jgi:E3 ubiquitin-protein ligase HERC2
MALISKRWTDLAPTTTEGFSKHYSALAAVCKFEATREDKPTVSYLEHRYQLLQLFNGELVKCLEQIDLVGQADVLDDYHVSPLQRPGGVVSQRTQTIRDLLSSGRGFIFYSIKKKYQARALEKTETAGSSKFELVLSRSRAAKFKSRGEVDHDGRWSVFGQAFRKVHGMPPSVLRRSNQLWDTILASERAQDAGGPYREAWSAFCEDLMSPHLPLLRPSPNTVHNVGGCRGAFIINPDAAAHPVQAEMLVFLGKLMGSVVRSRNYLDITLSPLVWKLIAGEEVRLEDVNTSDALFVTNMNRFRAAHRAYDASKHDEVWQDFTFVVTSLSGREVELCPGGKSIEVNHETILEYCDSMEHYRLYEMLPACRLVRRGLETQLPRSALTLLTGRELEQLVCGKPTIDLELLKSATEYSGCAVTDPHIQWFWEVMRDDLSEEDKKAFIRFAWGRSRLPISRANFSQPMKIQNLSRTPPDNYLPESHTCFFTVDFPRYSSKGVMKEKLLYAIRHCVAIDGDNTNTGMRAGNMVFEE